MFFVLGYGISTLDVKLSNWRLFVLYSKMFMIILATLDSNTRLRQLDVQVMRSISDGRFIKKKFDGHRWTFDGGGISDVGQWSF